MSDQAKAEGGDKSKGKQGKGELLLLALTVTST